MRLSEFAGKDTTDMINEWSRKGHKLVYNDKEAKDNFLSYLHDNIDDYDLILKAKQVIDAHPLKDKDGILKLVARLGISSYDAAAAYDALVFNYAGKWD